MGEASAPVHIIAVGGLDPHGGAGLVRDRITACAWGATCDLVGTAWAEQGEEGVIALDVRPPARVAAAMRRALRAGAGRRVAVKIGVVATPACAAAIAAELAAFKGPSVVDPVLGASRGGHLFLPGGDSVWQGWRPLLHRATLVTPNLDEAAALVDAPVRTLADARRAARHIIDLGAQAVLVKGGHLTGDAVDVLVWRGGERLFARPRIAGPSPRGTGCALAVAIAERLAQGYDLPDAVEQGGDWLRRQIQSAIEVGSERHLS